MSRMPVKPQRPDIRQQPAAAQRRIDRQPNPRDVLRKDRRRRRACDAPAEPEHEQQIERDIEPRREPEEAQRRDRVARRPQQTREEIIQKCGQQPREDDHQISPHLPIQLLRDLQKAQNRVQKRIDQHVQYHRHREDQPERMPDRAAQQRLVLLSQCDRKQRSGPH